MKYLQVCVKTIEDDVSDREDEVSSKLIRLQDRSQSNTLGIDGIREECDM